MLSDRSFLESEQSLLFGIPERHVRTLAYNFVTLVYDDISQKNNVSQHGTSPRDAMRESRIEAQSLSSLPNPVQDHVVNISI